MDDLARCLQPWACSAAHLERLQAQYRTVLSDPICAPAVELREACAAHRGRPAVYAWTLEHAGRRHRIYVGKTNSLGGRLRNYVAGFQPHSPNDFKLRVFHDFVAELLPAASFELHATNCDAPDLTARENEAIAFFQPLLNRRMQATDDARHALESAFAAYYRSCFRNALDASR